MKESIFFILYAQPLQRIVGIMLIMLNMWIWVKKILDKKLVWKLLNIGSVLISILAIVMVTLVSREGSNAEMILIPFYTFKEAKSQPELYRSMLMNVFLFFPVGLTLPYALPEKWNRQGGISLFFAVVFSAAIEYAQYYHHLGRAEVDDVICNTLGCAIGTLSYRLSEIITYKRNIKCKKGRKNETT